MDRFIARANITHFADLLSKEADAAKREVIERLLCLERQKLDTAERQESDKSRGAGLTQSKAPE